MRKQLLLLAAALLAYGWSLTGSFHFDDYSLAQNPFITATTGLWRMWGPLETRPLTNLTFWINYHLGASNPIGYHVVNLLLHAGSVLLLYTAVKLIVAEAPAFWAALIFAIHPIQSEAVCYVFARSTLLCTLLCLASLWFGLTNKWRWSIVLFACALLSKEECITFPFLFLLLANRSRTVIRAVTAMLALSLIAGLRVLWATQHIAGSGAGFTAGITPWHYLATQGAALLRYLQLLLLPWGFTIEPTVAVSLTAWCIIFLILGLTVWAFRRQYPWAAWILMGFILLIPSSTIFPAADQAADRRMYLPMLAFATAFGVITPWFWVQAPPIIAATLLTLSMARTEVWRNEQSLWREAVQRSPTHLRPLLQLARVTPMKEAVPLLQNAKSLDPNNAAASAELGRIFLINNNPASALQEFGRALALQPNDPNALNNRGAALLALKQQKAAKLDFERALHIDPCMETARRNWISVTAEPPPPCPARAR